MDILDRATALDHAGDITEVLHEVLVDLDDTLLERSLRSLKVVVFNLALEHHRRRPTWPRRSAAGRCHQEIEESMSTRRTTMRTIKTNREVEALKALAENFESSAAWRRRKAEEHPDDDRNLDAATELDALAKSVANVSPGTAAQYAELWSDDSEGYRVTEEEQEMIRSAGFHSFWDSAEEFIGDLVERIKRVERIRGDDLDADL